MHFLVNFAEKKNMQKSSNVKKKIVIVFGGAFRNQPNIYDGDFLAK